VEDVDTVRVMQRTRRRHGRGAAGARRALRRETGLVVLAALAMSVLVSASARAQTTPPPEPAPPSVPASPDAPAAAPSPPPVAPTPPPAPPTPPPAPPIVVPPPPPAFVPVDPTQPDPAEARAAELRVAIPPPGSARVPAEDPQADRGVLGPTAYTHPKGTFYVSDYDLALFQLGYAFTDDTQISLTGLPPIGDERLVALDITLKSTLYRGGLVRVAALGSASGFGANEIGVVGVGRVGGVVQLCVERDCTTSLSLSSNVALAGALVMGNGATGIFRMSRSMSLLAELDTVVPLGKDTGNVNGALASGGVRFCGTRWGVDLALMHVLGPKNDLTLPFAALTYRSAP
jgi:hypothetical protein